MMMRGVPESVKAVDKRRPWFPGERVIIGFAVALLVVCAAIPVRAQCGGPFKLTASDGAASDYFGYSVDVSGDIAVVGAYGDDSGRGSAYVYRWEDSGWTQLAKLTASDGVSTDRFGRSVAISGDTIVTGAYGDDDNGTGSGSAYVFVKPPGGWTNTTQTAKLTPSDASNYDWFGYSVTIRGETIGIGAYHKNVGANAGQGAAYIFAKPAGGWITTSAQVAKLTPPDGAAYNLLGASVAIWGDTLIVGADGDDSSKGSAHVFHRTGSSWVQSERTMLASDGAAGDLFGDSIAVSGDTMVVGASRDDVGANVNQGSAYVYR